MGRTERYLKWLFGGMIFSTLAIMGVGIYALIVSPYTGLRLVFGDDTGLGYLELPGSSTQGRILPINRLIKIEGIILEKQDLLRFPEFFFHQNEARWWQKQRALYNRISEKDSLRLEFIQENNQPLVTSVTVIPTPLLGIAKKSGLIYLIALIFLALAINLYKHPSLPDQLCAFFSAFVGLYFTSAAPVAYRDITLPPELFKLLIKGVFIGAGGTITLVHFALIFPKPKSFLTAHPKLIYVLYIYSLIGVILYLAKVTAFGTTFPFLFFWVLVMVGAFLHSWFSENDPLLKGQIRLALAAPVIIGLVFVILLLLPAFLDLPPMDFSYFALFSLVLPFALSFALDNLRLYQDKLVIERTAQREKEQIRQDLHDGILTELASAHPEIGFLIRVSSQDLLVEIHMCDTKASNQLHCNRLFSIFCFYVAVFLAQDTPIPL